MRVSRGGLAAALTALALLLAAAGLAHVAISSDLNIFFSEHNPERLEFEAFEDRFGAEEAATFTLGRDDHTLWNADDLAALRWLTDRVAVIPHVARVQSLVNFQFSRAVDDDIAIGDFVPRGTTPDAAALARLRSEAQADPRIAGLLVSPDGRTAGVYATVNAQGIDDAETAEVYRRAYTLTDEFRARYPNLAIHFSGTLAVDQSFQRASLTDGERLNPLMVLLFALIALLVWRSVLLALAVLVLVSLLAAATMGAAGWLGYPVTPVSAVAPIIVMSVFVANAVHVIHAAVTARERGMDARAASAAAVHDNRLPIAFTALTTVIGFASLNFADSPPFRHLGNLVMVGVVLAAVCSVTLLPAVLSRTNPRRTALYAAARALAARLAAVGHWPRRRHAVLVVSAITASLALAALGFAQTRLDDNFIKFFGPSYPMRLASDYSAERLVGSYYVEYVLDSGSDGGIDAPTFLHQVADFCAWLRARDDVAHAICLTDTLARLNANVHGEDPAFRVVPDDPDLAAQLLLLLETSLPKGQDVGNQVDVAHRALRLTALTPDVSSAELRALKTAGEAWFDAHAGGEASASGTGVGVMFSFVSLRNIQGMLAGTLMVVVLIGVTFTGLLRNLRLGALSLVPNLLPLAAAFGVWGLVVHNIGMTVAVISAICVGIIVDDTIHFVMRYHARRRDGATTADAIAHAYATAGTAMILTSAILVTGFLVLGLSDFAVTWTMGYFAALTIALALLFDLLVLPSLLVLVEA
ncbi:MAG: MMPL family transporter [Gammaproteobacteria bacterium]|nr:MMPL family transporter [Gammaproteobacteria bacterium]